MQQMFAYPSVFKKSLLATLLEIALFHPRTQKIYANLTTHSDFNKLKPIIRLIADLLQLGFYNFFYLSRLLEWCFPGNEVVWKISLGLHMVHSFYRLTGDLSYWYLGMALFVFPHLPFLLENLGVPVTHALNNVCNKVVQMFIGQSLLNNFVEDDNRIEQQNRELVLCDARVKKGRNRFKHFTELSFFFEAENDNLNHTKASQTQMTDSLIFSNSIRGISKF